MSHPPSPTPDLPVDLAPPMTRTELYAALVGLCQYFGTTTDATYDLLNSAIDSIRPDGSPETDPADDYAPRSHCVGCGFPLVYLYGEWQHDAAPDAWGNDHDPEPGTDGDALAAAWDAAHPDGDEVP